MEWGELRWPFCMDFSTTQRTRWWRTRGRYLSWTSYIWLSWPQWGSLVFFYSPGNSFSKKQIILFDVHNQSIASASPDDCCCHPCDRDHLRLHPPEHLHGQGRSRRFLKYRVTCVLRFPTRWLSLDPHWSLSALLACQQKTYFSLNFTIRVFIQLTFKKFLKTFFYLTVECEYHNMIWLTPHWFISVDKYKKSLKNTPLHITEESVTKGIVKP